MRDPRLDSILNPPHEELHATGCSWHLDSYVCDCGTLDDMGARSSAEEQGPSKPKVAGSTPAERDIQEAQLELAREVTLNLIRDCSQATIDELNLAFSLAVQRL